MGKEGKGEKRNMSGSEVDEGFGDSEVDGTSEDETEDSSRWVLI